MENETSGQSTLSKCLYRSIIAGVLGIFCIFIYCYISSFNPLEKYSGFYTSHIDPIFIGYVLVFFALSISIGIISVAWSFTHVHSKTGAMILGGISGFAWGLIYLIVLWNLITNAPISAQKFSEYPQIPTIVYQMIWSLSFDGFILSFILVPIVSTIIVSVLYYIYADNIRQNDDSILIQNRIRRDGMLAIVLMLIVSIFLPLLPIYLQAIE